MEINIISRGFRETQKVLNDVVKSHSETVNQLLHVLGEEIVLEAKTILVSNGNIDTGGLLGSIQILKEIDKEIIVGSDASHASIIEFGHGPIRPVNATILRFFDKNTGKLVFTKFVGPTEPSPFLQPAVEKKTSRFSDVYTQKINSKIQI